MKTAGLCIPFVLAIGCGVSAATGNPDAATVATDGSPLTDAAASADGTADVVAIVSDITPKSGRGATPSGANVNGGPWAMRMMLATSSDAKTFARTHESISDQAGVPNAFVDREGRLRLTYIDWGNGNIIATAVRNTNGQWAYRRITFNPALTTSKPDPVDPTIVKLTDGSYRLFFMHLGKFLSGRSQDGFVFALEEGERFPYDKPLYDPVVVETPTGWWLWANVGTPTFAYGKSTDGLHFVAEANLFRIDGKSISVWSAAQVNGGYRISGGLEGAPGISSAWSADGVSWKIEGTMLSDQGANPALEQTLSPDHGYTQLPDATHVIAYLAQIP